MSTPTRIDTDKEMHSLYSRLDSALIHEAALQKELEALKFAAANVIVEGDALQRRLTDAEHYVQKMIYCSRGQDSIAAGYLANILDVIRGNK